MINFKFLKSEIKNNIFIIVGFAIILVLFSVLSMSFTKYFQTTYDPEDGWYTGALEVLQLVTLFGPVGEILAVVFSVALAVKLFSIEITRGYLASWLALPMSRITIFLTKILPIVLSSLIIISTNLFAELIILAIQRYPEFTGHDAWNLIKLNFGLLLTFLLVSSIPVIFSIWFNKISFVITLSIAILVGFIAFFILSTFSEFFGSSSLEYLKYLTIFSLFNMYQLIDFNNYAFIWKFILMLVLSSCIFTGSGFLFKMKNFYI